MYNEYFNFPLQGWQCPICHKIFNPSQSECPYCNKEVTVQTTGTIIDDSGWWKQYQQHTTADSDANINFSSRTGLMPEVELENINWRDWLDTTREQIRKEMDLK